MRKKVFLILMLVMFVTFLTTASEWSNSQEYFTGDVVTRGNEEYEALFTSQTITGNITIEKTDYETEEIEVTIVINMEEVLPGIPSSYFFMVLIAVAAVVIALVSYRAIQNAKIPKFVKRVREIKKSIQARKNISDSLLYPSKDETILKMMKDEWEMLGLSLEKILGIANKKSKVLSDAKESSEGGAA